jgi:hypothetical protein
MVGRRADEQQPAVPGLDDDAGRDVAGPVQVGSVVNGRAAEP